MCRTNCLLLSAYQSSSMRRTLIRVLHHPFGKIFLAFILWRVALFCLAYISSVFFAFHTSFPYVREVLSASRLPQWIWSFAGFDGVHYLSIAMNGYEAQYTQVFFPFYPLLIRFFHILLPFLHPILIGLFISNSAFLCTLFVLYKLIEMDFGRLVAFRSILCLLLFPTSFFFGSLYSESIFLLFVVSSFYLTRRRKWYFAGIVGGIASGTRLIGIFLLPSLLSEFFHQMKRSKSLWLLIRSPLLYIVPFGLISYMTYLLFSVGDFLYFWHVQPLFGGNRSGGTIILFPQLIWRYMKIFYTVSYSQYAYWPAVWEMASFVAAFLLLAFAIRIKIRMSYLIFSILSLIVPTLTGTLASFPRYLIIAFPIYIALAHIYRGKFFILFSITSGSLLTIFTLLFTSGYWVS